MNTVYRATLSGGLIGFFATSSKRTLEGILSKANANGEEVVFAHDEVFLTIDFDFAAAVLAEQDAIASLDVEGDDLAEFIAGTRAGGDDLAFHRLFLGGVGNDDPASGLLFGGDTADHDPVVQGTELHGIFS